MGGQGSRGLSTADIDSTRDKELFEMEVLDRSDDSNALQGSG